MLEERFRAGVQQEVKRQGIKNSQLAKSIGVSEAHISRVLRGQSSMTFEFADKLCRVLGVDPSVLFGANIELSVVVKDKREEKFAKRLLKLFRSGLQRPIEEQVDATLQDLNKRYWRHFKELAQKQGISACRLIVEGNDLPIWTYGRASKESWESHKSGSLIFEVASPKVSDWWQPFEFGLRQLNFILSPKL